MDILDLYRKIDVKMIEEFVENNKEENLLIDFKTVNNAELSNKNDHHNFAKALSGFANSDGGLIVWGVDARKNKQGIDCACGYKEIEPLSLFVSKLNEFTGQFVRPIVEGVKHKKIEKSKDKGFAITLIPPSEEGPHMAKAGLDRYYKRSGDSFYRMEHYDIEDMFGRRKKPKLSLYTDIIVSGTGHTREGDIYWRSVIISIKNTGRGLAKHVCLKLKLNHPFKVDDTGLDGMGRTGLPIIPQRRGSPYIQYGGNANVVVHPSSFLEITRISYKFRESTTTMEDLIIESAITAEEMKAVKQKKVIKGSQLIKDLS